MRINKQAVLDKIDAYYVGQATELHGKQSAQQKRWDTWRAQQANKSPDLATTLRALAVRVEDGELVTKHDIDQATDKLVHDRAVPYNERKRQRQVDWYEFPKRRPDVEDVDTILARYREGGRFSDLLGVLHNMVGDDVAVSSLQKLGVLDTTDARLIFAANKAAA